MLPAKQAEIERIYLRSLGAGMQSLAVVSSNPGEGVTSLAIALAQRHLLAGKSTLFVDLGGHGPNHQVAIPVGKQPETGPAAEPHLLTDSEGSYALLGIPAPRATASSLAWRNPGTLETHMKRWLDQFDAVIIDAGNFSQSADDGVPAERVVSACGATLLVVMAGITTVPVVRRSCERIQSAGGQLAGCVFNDRHNPSLKREMLRESARLPNALARIKNALIHWIERNPLLSLDM